MPAVVCENISCGSPPYLLNPVPPNEKPSCLNQYPVRVVSLDASFLAVYTVTKFLRRTIPLCGFRSAKDGHHLRGVAGGLHRPSSSRRTKTFPYVMRLPAWSEDVCDYCQLLRIAR